MANQHITPKGDKWQVKGEGNTKATKLFDTQEEAIAYAKQIAGNQEAKIVVHRPDGTIRKVSGVRVKSGDSEDEKPAKAKPEDKKAAKAKAKAEKKAAKEKAKREKKAAKEAKKAKNKK